MYSMSHETGHEGDLIVLIQGNEVWRIEASHNQFNLPSIVTTKLFTIIEFQTIRAVEVYDDFAVVIF